MKKALLALLLAAAASATVRAERPMRAFLLRLATGPSTGSASFDTNVWNAVTDRLSANGIDTLVVALGDGIVWPSHPELAVPSAWDGPRLAAELARLRKLGLEPVPQVPSRGDGTVSADLVRDAVRLFGRPRFVRLEAPSAALCAEVARQGARAWVTVGSTPECRAAALKELPADVLVSNCSAVEGSEEGLREFAAAGFDVVACGSSTSRPQKSMETVAGSACAAVGAARLRGFLLESGRETVRDERDELMMAAFRCGEALAARTTARTSPDWFVNAVIYQMQLRGFTPEGTLAAARARLGKIRALGFDLVYLCPIWVSDDNPDRTKWSGRQQLSGMENPRNPYVMKDFDHVDPEYGTDEDFRAFVAEAHRLGLRVMTDLVYRHCGWGAVFLRSHRDYAMKNPDGTVRVVGPGFPLPRLDYESRGLREMLVANMVRMVRDFGVDGFRTDMSDEVPLEFWAEGRAACERYRPDLVMIAEGVHPGNLARVFNANYAHFTCREGLMAHLYGGRPLPCVFPANSLKEGARSFRGACEWETGWLPRGGRLMTFIENHDTAQDGGEGRAERLLGHANQAAGLATVFALPGVPLVYNGQEICDASRLSLFARSGVNAIDWSRENSPEARERRDLLTRLIALRRSRPALTSTLIEWLENDCPQSVVSFIRRDGKGDAVFFIANLSGEPVKTTVESRGVHELGPWAFRFVSLDEPLLPREVVIQPVGGLRVDFGAPADGDVEIAASGPNWGSVTVGTGSALTADGSVATSRTQIFRYTGAEEDVFVVKNAKNVRYVLAACTMLSELRPGSVRLRRETTLLAGAEGEPASE